MSKTSAQRTGVDRGIAIFPGNLFQTPMVMLVSPISTADRFTAVVCAPPDPPSSAPPTMAGKFGKRGPNHNSNKGALTVKMPFADHTINFHDV
jgi:hypothetical protein